MPINEYIAKQFANPRGMGTELTLRQFTPVSLHLY